MSPNPPQGDQRTLMAAVLFADLVGYSRKPVTDQFAAKGSFHELLHGVLAPLAPDSRLVLDTGDGAAIAFLADPEHALYVALELHRMLAMRAGDGMLDPGDLRLGINLGPVKRMVDLNGQPNLVGEGMNTAERVMSFASPGEITASRAYCDAISCLRESYRRLFESLGRRADKHGREHEVFRVNATSTALEEARSSVGIVVGGDGSDAPGQAMKGSPPPSGASQVGRKGLAWAAAIVVVALSGAAVAWLAAERDQAEVTQPAAARPTSGKLPEAKPLPPSPAEPPANAVAGSAAALPPAQPTPVPRAERAADPAPPRTGKPVQREQADPGNSSRCSALTQRAALGEALAPKDQEELRKSCR
jgi:class 3 adenylate cyclase